ncbi:MAG: hypothetical protein M3383_03160 [Actinomycetota bacterium]|nr:hypothetical protein [Actinomycetota bacterium]
MSPMPKRSRFRLVAALAATAALALAATAGAVVYIYKNNFSSHGEYKEIDQVGGGKRICQEKYVPEKDKMRVSLKGERFCVYAPPIEGDSGRPDHDIVVAASYNRGDSSDRAKKATFLAVRVRAGGESNYELRIRPDGRNFRMYRNGDPTGLPGGSSTAVKPLGKLNTLRLRVLNDVVVGYVNREEVGRFTDPVPGQVTGRRVTFGTGFDRDVPRGPVAFFDLVKVGVPNP